MSILNLQTLKEMSKLLPKPRPVILRFECNQTHYTKLMHHVDLVSSGRLPHSAMSDIKIMMVPERQDGYWPIYKDAAK